MIVRMMAPTVHAINILKVIANQQEEMFPANDICKELDMTKSYFMRIIKDMKKAGFVESVQGRYGGFTLSRPPENISLFEIVEAMEINTGMPDGKLKELIEETNDEINKKLQTISLSSL